MIGAGVQFKRNKLHKPTTADIQEAIERAGVNWRARTGRPATHVLLPPEADPAALKLWTLAVASGRAQAGVVIVGEDGADSY